MDFVDAAMKVKNIADEDSNFVVHEAKYALLGVTLFIIFSVHPTNALIVNIFPRANGPMIYIYKVILFICIFYIVQKTAWFQKL
tara:strand:- start:2649 stop:2900 length:252 start_codon:yes stop_codon:yes gene_type:complete